MSDPCQCIFDHEAAMRRLINWLRENQNDQISDNLPGTSTGSNVMIWTMLWGLIAFVMFYIRPNNLRAQPRDPSSEKRGPNNTDNNQPPPPDVL